MKSDKKPEQSWRNSKYLEFRACRFATFIRNVEHLFVFLQPSQERAPEILIIFIYLCLSLFGG